MRNTYPRTLRALAVVCLLAGSAVAAPINIDTFDLGSAQEAVFGTGGKTGGEVIADVSQTIGGVRRYSIAGLGTGTGVTTLAVLGGRVGLGTLSMVAPYSGTWALQYGYTADGTASPLNADLIGSGTPNNGFLIRMASAEYGYTVSLTVHTEGVGASYTAVNHAADLNPHDIFVPFSSFAGMPVDFHDIDHIVLQVTGQPDGDYSIDSIIAVPEPVTLALLAMGGLVALRRKVC